MNDKRGFTIIEVLVAVLVLTVGVLSLVGTAGLVTRMVAQGHIDSEATALAAQRFEILRSEGCANMAASGSTTDGPYTVGWRVLPVANDRARRVYLAISQPTMNGQRSRFFSTTIFCGG